MLDFLFHPLNNAFSISFCIVIFICLLELCGQLIGLSVGQVLDNTIDIDAEINVDGTNSITTSADILSWLNLRKLPLLIWLVILLTAFSLVGYTSNYIYWNITSGYLPAVISLPLSLVLGLLTCNRLGGKLAKLMPKEESSAISKESFSGHLAKITIGTASQGQPAEAVFTDEHGQKHYVLVQPIEDEQINQGEQVVLVSAKDSQWLVTRFQ